MWAVKLGVKEVSGGVMVSTLEGNVHTYNMWVFFLFLEKIGLIYIYIYLGIFPNSRMYCIVHIPTLDCLKIDPGSPHDRFFFFFLVCFWALSLSNLSLGPM